MERFISFVLGLATGAAIGILLAPAPGSETRRRIKEEADKLVDDALSMKKRIKVNGIHEQVN